jgi:HTH-type transcriptional regulator / antitoxin HipB
MPSTTSLAPTRIESAADLGAAIRARRLESGLTLAIAAPVCGVSVKFLQALETGKATVQFDKALGVARHFGIHLTIT